MAHMTDSNLFTALRGAFPADLDRTAITTADTTTHTRTGLKITIIWSSGAEVELLRITK